MKDKVIGFVFVPLVAVLFYMLLTPITKPRPHGPLTEQASRMKELLLKLAIGYSHMDDTLSSRADMSLTNLIASTILDQDDIVYLKRNGIVYLGFQPDPLSKNYPAPVLVATNVKSQHPKRIVGFEDGSVAVQDLSDHEFAQQGDGAEPPPSLSLTFNAI